MTTFSDVNGNAVPVACTDDPEAWFPVRPRGKNANVADWIHDEQVDMLKAICARCPVTEACLKEALRWDDDGFRAGLTAEERREIRKRRQRGKRKGTAFSAALEAALADEKAARAARRGAA